MSTVVASAPVPPMPSHSHHDMSPKPYAATSNLAASAGKERKTASPSSTSSSSRDPIVVGENAAPKASSAGKPSPKQTRSGQAPQIVVKKEPSSPPDVPASARHRPHKLDLTSSASKTAAQGSLTSRPSAPLTARDSSGLKMNDVGLACLSPGFQTHDPSMREQLQRSISVRDQQRHIIESRLQKTAKTSDGSSSTSDRPIEQNPLSALKTPTTSSKKRPPPGLSIVPPSHEQFANERVIQSAPLHQSFAGRHHPHPATRHTANGPSNLSNTSHIHASQPQNRLPPIADVFAHDSLGMRDGPASNSGPSPSAGAQRSTYFPPTTASAAHRPAFPSPGLPPPPHAQHPHSHQQPPPPPPPSQAPHAAMASQPHVSRPREYRSAEEAVADMAQGREDLLPKIVHYNGHHPHTPPSPTSAQRLTPNKTATAYHAYAGGPSSGERERERDRDAGPRSASGGRRRTRVEYERDEEPLGTASREAKRGFAGAWPDGRESPGAAWRRKEEFLGLCARAWDLMHS